MVINIIDREFNFLGQIDEYESFIATKRWHGIGGFELHLHVKNTHAEHLQKENIIFTTERKPFVILHREINSANGKLIVKGLELKSYLARAIVFPPVGQAYFRINSNVETIMKDYVTATMTRKNITNIVVAPNQKRGLTTVYQSRYKNLAEELEKLSLASGLGWDVVLDLDNKQFIFDVAEGRNITTNQNTLPPAIFSIDYDNIGEQRLVESRVNYANTAIVAGQGEGVEREIVVVGDPEGLDSFEIFVDARDIENAADLPPRGEQKLAESREIFTFDSEVLTDRNLIYEEDFRLGDIVTIQNGEWGVTTDRRITEVSEVYESTGFRLDVSFGESLPTILDVVKQATDVPIAEGGSQGEEGPPGKDGTDGVGLQFTWDGTSLGVKREDETEYQFVNLQGPKGGQGEQGPPGESLEFHWNGTQLGVRVEGQTQYQYVDLKGSQGERGPRGFSLEYDWQGTQLGIKREDESNYQYVDLRGPKGDKGDKGDQGLPGVDGKSIEFTWSGTQLGVRQEGQSQYQFVDLKGDKGDKGDTGERGPQGIQGPSGKSLEFTWNGTSLGVRQEGQSSYQYVNLKGEKGDKGDKGEKGDKGDPGSDANVTYENVTNALGYTPVNKAGDTMTGPLALTGSIFDTEFKADNWNLINKYTGGGWARGLLNVKNKDGTNYIQIGGFGSGQNFTRLYIGKAWNDWLLGINPNNNTVEVQGNLTKNGKEVATKEDIPTESGGGTKIVTSPTEPEELATGDQWHREY